MDYKRHEVSKQTSFSFGIGVPGVFELGFDFNDARHTKSIQKIRRASSKVMIPTTDTISGTKTWAGKKSSPVFCQFSPQSSTFVASKAQLEMAQYMLRPNNLMLHPEFMIRLRSLPQSYAYGEYRQIYRDYGTHYVTEATLGGEFEHIVILNNETSKKSGNGYWFLPKRIHRLCQISLICQFYCTCIQIRLRSLHHLHSELIQQLFVALDYTLEDYGRCTNAGLKAGINIDGAYVSGGVHGGSCSDLLTEEGGEVSFLTLSCVSFHGPEPMLKLNVSLQGNLQVAA